MKTDCDGDKIFRTYFINNRGDEALGSTWSYLDMTALGRIRLPKSLPSWRKGKIELC
jgi:predicted dithiol-disulfide oxidoreductase (DUF899 family)